MPYNGHWSHFKEISMERLEEKKINGRTYYYYSNWGWVNGRCKRIWQKYLGTLNSIVKAVESGGQTPAYAEVFEYGLPTALWEESVKAEIIPIIDGLHSKRRQGLSIGEYLAIAAINRAMCPVSKNSMWDWFNKTSLLRNIPNATKDKLSSQSFWEHMDKISSQNSLIIWKKIVSNVLKQESIDLSSITYDGTNFYTFMNTFNMKCPLAKRGKNKQGRNKLRQFSYALFCSADSHIPLFYNLYEGNRNDAKQFSKMLEQFHSFLEETFGADVVQPKTTLIFDKGNNSKDNFVLLDSYPSFNYVGSVKLDEHKDLADISINDLHFKECQGLKDTKAFKVQKIVYDKPRTLVISYNKNLAQNQLLTVHNDIQNATDKLQALQEKLQDRINGIITKGKKPTLSSIKKQCQEILYRPYMKTVIPFVVYQDENGFPNMEYEIDTRAIDSLADTYLGKTIIITNMEQWSEKKIIEAYRSQFIIEDVFKEMKDREIGTWWPLFHWTEQKVHVHALYCTVAILLRALIYRRIRETGVKISLKRLLYELNDIREVINVYSVGKRKRRETRQTVFTKLSEIQKTLLTILQIEKRE